MPLCEYNEAIYVLHVHKEATISVKIAKKELFKNKIKLLLVVAETMDMIMILAPSHVFSVVKIKVM